mgnify:CR=1 FL=1
MMRANRKRLKERAIQQVAESVQAFPDYGRKTARKSRPGWSEGLDLVGGMLRDMDGLVGNIHAHLKPGISKYGGQLRFVVIVDVHNVHNLIGAHQNWHLVTNGLNGADRLLVFFYPTKPGLAFHPSLL